MRHQLFFLSGLLFLFNLVVFSTTTSAADKETVATVGGQVITLEELNQAAEPDLRSIEQEIFNIKSQHLENLIDERLWDLEAKSKKVSVEELRKIALSQRSSDISEDQIRALYQNAGGRLGSYEEAKGKIRQMLSQQMNLADERAYLDGLREKYEVKINMEPPRLPVDLSDTPIRGKANAPVMIVEFSDFECPFCSRVQSTIQRIRSEYPNDVRFSFKHFPLPFHKNARQAHLAALCAEEQGKFWEFRDFLFGHANALGKSQLFGYADQLGLDMPQFEKCMTEEKYNWKIDRDLIQGQKSGISGTPGFLVNGRLISGAQEYDAFARIIEQELKRS